MRIPSFCRQPVFFIGLFLVVLVVPMLVSAHIGVGVGLGRIQLEKVARPGGIYELPSMPVLNTGDETSEYEVEIQYHQDQPQLRPPSSWFTFAPSPFSLKPGEVRLVKTTLTIPVRAEPGDYFAYVEGRAVQHQGAGTHIGVAAAAKLYFSVAPANGWEGIRFRLMTLYKKYSPWPQIVLAIVAVAVLVLIGRKFVSFNIGIRKK